MLFRSDKRSVEALDIAEKYANGDATKKEIDATSDAARDAAWAVARATAGAVRAAAWAATRAAQEKKLRDVLLESALKEKNT